MYGDRLAGMSARETKRDTSVVAENAATTEKENDRMIQGN